MSFSKIYCNCGMCNHIPDSECIQKECRCCFNFHIRSSTN